MPVHRTHAYTLFTLRAIDPGESITVSYANDGSYFEGHQCACATCNPDAPPIAAKRPIDLSKFIKRECGKRTRRGGKREKRRKKAKSRDEAVEDTHAAESVAVLMQVDISPMVCLRIPI